MRQRRTRSACLTPGKMLAFLALFFMFAGPTYSHEHDDDHDHHDIGQEECVLCCIVTLHAGGFILPEATSQISNSLPGFLPEPHGDFVSDLNQLTSHYARAPPLKTLFQ